VKLFSGKRQRDTLGWSYIFMVHESNLEQKVCSCFCYWSP